MAILAVLGYAQGMAFAQDASPAPVAQMPVADEIQLGRIRTALATMPVVASEIPTFYARVEARPPTFADYMTGWDLRITPLTAPGQTVGATGGLDLLQVWRRALQAYRDREARQIRARIDRELAALPTGVSSETDTADH